MKNLHKPNYEQSDSHICLTALAIALFCALFWAVIGIVPIAEADENSDSTASAEMPAIPPPASVVVPAPEFPTAQSRSHSAVVRVGYSGEGARLESTSWNTVLYYNFPLGSDSPSSPYTVRIALDGATADEFTLSSNTDGVNFDTSSCGSAICAVIIPHNLSTGGYAHISITPIADDKEGEGDEVWTLRILPGYGYAVVARTLSIEVLDWMPPLPIDRGIYNRGFYSSTSVSDLDEYDPAARTPEIRFQRKGGSPFQIAEKQYSDNRGNPVIISQSLQYANLVIELGWQPELDGLTYGHKPRKYYPLADNFIIPPAAAAGIGEAIYDIEGETQLYDSRERKFFRFYPDGHLRANFGSGIIRGWLSIDGDDADDDFGSGAMLPDDNGGMRPVAADDDFSVALFGSFVRDGFFVRNTRSEPATGYFSRFANGFAFSGGGVFYDSADYDNTASAPAELAGRFFVRSSAGNFHGGFLGKRRMPPPLSPPTPTDGVTTANLESYSQPIMVADDKLYQAPAGQNIDILVKSQEFAHLGIWMNTDFPEPENFEYQILADNEVTAPAMDAAVRVATYNIDSEGVYKNEPVTGNGTFIAEFFMNRVGGALQFSGENVDGSMRIFIIADIDGEGMTGNATITRATGFFYDLIGPVIFRRVPDMADIRFHDSADYDRANDAPREISGVFAVPDINDKMLNGGLLGKKRLSPTN